MAERLFSKHHIWVLKEGDTGILGITDHAQEKLKSIMFVNLPDTGDMISDGKRFGDIESIKTVSDLIAPVSGEVTDVNEELIDSPELLNDAPYDNWLIKVKNISSLEDLMDEETYLKSKDDP